MQPLPLGASPQYLHGKSEMLITVALFAMFIVFSLLPWYSDKIASRDLIPLRFTRTLAAVVSIRAVIPVAETNEATSLFGLFLREEFRKIAFLPRWLGRPKHVFHIFGLISTPFWVTVVCFNYAVTAIRKCMWRQCRVDQAKIFLTSVMNNVAQDSLSCNVSSSSISLSRSA